MKLIFLGPPGSGKGTQAKMLAESFSIAHISMGDILREAIKNETEIGKKAANYLKEGLLVPDQVVNEIAKEAIEKVSQKGFVLDGYPRTQQQAEFISKITDVDKVVYIDVSQSEIIKRLSGRRNCKNCGAVYHINNNPPGTADVCDACGGQLYIRHDDKEETLKKRFEVFEKETNLLVRYYNGKVVKISGLGSLNSVFEAIKAAV